MKWRNIICGVSVALLLAGCMGTRSSAPVSHRGKAPAQAKVKKAPAKRGSVYTVRKGDTLYSIAWQYGHDYKTLAQWNEIKSPYTLYIGRRIKVKRPVRVAARKQSAPVSENKVTKPVRKAKKSATKTAKKNRPAKKYRKAGTAKLTWKWPANGKLIQKFSPSQPGKKGIDIAGRLGQPVNAASPGRVVYSGSGLIGYGKLIIIKHNNRFLSAYAHNNKIFVKEGDTVKRGQRIAEIGKSGTDRAMLHFEIRRDGKPVNPLRYLPRRRS